MKNLALSFLLLSTMSYPFGFFDFNLGLTAAVDINVNTRYLHQYGKLYAYNKADINVTTLRGSGTITGSYTKLNCDNYYFDGTITGSEECQIKTQVLEANGKIEGKKVVIECNEFNFQGIIDAQECVIYTKKPFDYSQFQRNSNGKYTIIIAKYGFEPHTDKTLYTRAISKFTENLLSLSDEKIENELRSARSHAVLNKINDVQLLEKIKEEVKERVAYYHEQREEKRGPVSDLQEGTTCTVIGTASMTLAAVLIAHRKEIAERYNIEATVPATAATIAVAFGGALYYGSYHFLSHWLNPQYKEKYEKLSLILSRIDQSLQNPRVPEEEVVILQ